MTTRCGRLSVLVAVSAACIAAPASISAQARRDPLRSDIPVVAKFPASMAELRIPSHGSGLNGFMYMPSGSGTHGVVIMLHGFPGNEKNTDLMQAIRRAGYNVLYFDYRGSWGSAGTFSFANSRDDIASALAWVRDPTNVTKYRFDTQRIAVIGHSLGGWLALESTGRDANVGCVGGIAAWNIGHGASMLKADTAARKSTAAYLTMVTDPSSGPIRAKDSDLMREFDDNITSYDYLRLAPSLKNRSVFLAAATNDSPDEGVEMHARLERALKAAGSTHVRNVTFDDDHPFSAHRVALADALVKWLATDCTTVWAAKR